MQSAEGFLSDIFLLKSNSIKAYPMVHYVPRMNQSAAFVHVSRTNQIGA